MIGVLQELGEPVRIHRKAWEMGSCIAGLQSLGAVTPGAVGLSVGAGAERSLFWFANHVDKMIATDLYTSEEGWGWGRDFLAHPSKYAPFPYQEDHLEVRNMSGLALEIPDESVDFVYTLSSIEHFGGHEAAQQAMREMARITRSGGTVCVVTELLLSRAEAPELFTFPDLQTYLIEGSPLTLTEPMVDLRISASLLQYPVNMLTESDSVSPHIVVTGWGDSQAVWTSVILFFRKP